MLLLGLFACDKGVEDTPLQDHPVCQELPVLDQQVRLLSRREVDRTLRDVLDAPAACDVHTFFWDGGTEVYLAGTFNDWTPEAMAWENGRWVSERQLKPGNWQYKYVVDGDWLPDPNNDWTTDDGYGGVNSVVDIQCSDVELALARPSADWPLESRPHGYDFDNHTTALVSSTLLLQAMETAALLAPEFGCQDTACALEAGRRLFRRELTDDEVDRFSALDPEVALRVMLVSPNFLYRSELGEPRQDGLYELRGPELASALSFFIWGMGPDDELLDAAIAGDLDTPEGLEQQALRLLNDPRAIEQKELFALQWLGLEGVPTMTKNAEFGHDERRAALAEASAFVADAQGVDELLSSPDSYPGEAGVLGLTAVLAATAHSDQTSPVRRGLFVRERILCQDLGTPPADAGGVPDVDPNASTRERFEQHANDPNCSSCHQFIDPVGFGFEHWDEVGQWRELDGTHTVDASGQLVSMTDGSAQPFYGVQELGNLLADHPTAHACYAEKTLAFAVGDTVPACVGEELATNDVHELMLAVVLSDTFRLREAN